MVTVFTVFGLALAFVTVIVAFDWLIPGTDRPKTWEERKTKGISMLVLAMISASVVSYFLMTKP